MHAACKDRTKDDPEVDAGSPERSRKRTEDRTKACDIEELDEKHLPRRQRDIVHAVFQTNRRCYLPRTPECPVDDCSIDQIADDERRERAKKCNHCLSLLPKINTRYAGVHRRPPCLPSSRTMIKKPLTISPKELLASRRLSYHNSPLLSNLFNVL